MHKILIIEDDQIIAEVYRNRLGDRGYNVAIAEDGEVGLDKIHTFKPDLVILDLILPKLSGVDLMKQIRSETAFANLPIIVFSNTYLSNMVKEAWKAGATKCLSKAACTPKQVLELVNSIFASGHVSSLPPALVMTDGQKPDSAVKLRISQVEDTLDGTHQFLGNASATIPALRDSFQILIKSSDDATRLKELENLFVRIHGLTGATVVGYYMIGEISDAFEALIKELRDRPQNINPSILRTVATTIDFLETLVKRGKPADSHRGPVPKILVVDDELLSRRAITHALDRAKLPATDVDDPHTALKLLTDNSYDLVFLDADMPGMNGFELCAKLRTLPNHRKTPVVFITALNDFEARANSTMAGANDFIAKPFPFVELALKALIYIFRARLDAKK